MQKNSTIYWISYLMKITLIQATIALTLFGIGFARDNYGQELLDKEVTATYENASLHTVLEGLATQAVVKLAYSGSHLNLSDKVTINAQNKPFGTILDELLTPRSIRYEVRGEYIVLTLAPETPNLELFTESPNRRSKAGQICALMQVTGKVTSSDGESLPGVNVVEKGTTNGTVTDIDGNYRLDVAEDAILIFSFIGYKTQEVAVNSRDVVDIIIKEDVMSLEAVEINAGYYTFKKREQTGNISRVTSEEIELQPIVSPLESLQGRMAGVEILPGGNQPGMASTIRIRGTNSLRDEGNYPLYIIDGVPINSTPVTSYSLLGNTGIDPLNTLNLSNIESIEVLKDADATAIYGSRGANGVILISTKKGGQQKTNIGVQIYSGMATVPYRLDLLNTEQYLQIRRKAFENDGVEPNESIAYDLLLWDQNKYTDWQDYFLGGTSSISDINLSASGGNATTNYRLGGSYHKQGTVYLGDFNYNKGTAGLNLNHISENKKLDINLTVNYGIDANNILAGGVNLSFLPFFLPPNSPDILNKEGDLNWDDWAEIGWNNPLEGYHNKSKIQSNNLVSNLGITYEFVRGLKFKTNLGYTYFNSEESIKKPKRSYSPITRESIGHSSAYLQSSRKSWIIEPQLIYNTKLDQGNIDFILGGTLQQNNSGLLGIQGAGYASESLIGNLNAAEELLYPANQNVEYRYAAIFARLGLKWKEKYFLNLTGRRDGSSRFGPDKQFANFGAIGSAWIFSEESFIKDKFSLLSFGKLRASYGTTGNDQIGDYGYLDAYEATPGLGGLYPTQLANPDYSWEVNKKLEAAIELRFFENRISFGLSWYQNRSSNQLVGYTLPGMTGFSSIQANLPATVQNRGWESEVSAFIIQSQDFKWETSLNVSFPKNKLVSYPGIEQSSYANTYRVGHPLNISLLYQYNGINPGTGFYSISDINGDSRYDYEDRVIIQDWNRKFYGGINNSLSYKNFYLQFLWQFVKQDGRISLFKAGDLSTQLAVVTDALGDESIYQQISQSSAASAAYILATNTTFPVEDASFLRLKTLSISYALPSDILKTIGVDNCKLFVNGQNLITLSPFNGLDPEMPIGGDSFSGLRTIACGLQLEF